MSNQPPEAYERSSHAETHPSYWTSLALALVLLVGAGTVSAKIYHWTDKAGTPHYSDCPEDVRPRTGTRSRTTRRSWRRAAGVNIIEGLNHRAHTPGAEAEEGVETIPRPPRFPRSCEFPGLAADPTKMLNRLKGPMVALAVVLTLIVFGFLFAFMAMALLIGCRLVGQEESGLQEGLRDRDRPVSRRHGGSAPAWWRSSASRASPISAACSVSRRSTWGSFFCPRGGAAWHALRLHGQVHRPRHRRESGRAGPGFLLGLGFVMCAGGAALLGAG